jgi:hypothetical protein
MGALDVPVVLSCSNSCSICAAVAVQELLMVFLAPPVLLLLLPFSMILFSCNEFCCCCLHHLVQNGERDRVDAAAIANSITAGAAAAVRR